MTMSDRLRHSKFEHETLMREARFSDNRLSTIGSADRGHIDSSIHVLLHENLTTTCSSLPLAVGLVSTVSSVGSSFTKGGWRLVSPVDDRLSHSVLAPGPGV